MDQNYSLISIRKTSTSCIILGWNRLSTFSWERICWRSVVARENLSIRVEYTLGSGCWNIVGMCIGLDLCCLKFSFLLLQKKGWGFLKSLVIQGFCNSVNVIRLSCVWVTYWLGAILHFTSYERVYGTPLYGLRLTCPPEVVHTSVSRGAPVSDYKKLWSSLWIHSSVCVVKRGRNVARLLYSLFQLLAYFLSEELNLKGYTPEMT